MASIPTQFNRVLETRHHIGVPDVIAIVAVILSLLTLTLFLPAGMHLPF